MFPKQKNGLIQGCFVKYDGGSKVYSKKFLAWQQRIARAEFVFEKN